MGQQRRKLGPGSVVTANIPVNSWDKEERQGNEPERCPHPKPGFCGLTNLNTFCVVGAGIF